MRIDASHAATGGRSRQTSNDIMSQPAPAHVDTLRWNLADASERQHLLDTKAPQSGAQQPQTSGQQDADSSRLIDPNAIGGVVWGSGQGIARQGSSLIQRGIEHTLRGESLGKQSAEIFTRYPAHYVQQWDFSISPVNNKGGSTPALGRYLDGSGILHNGQQPHRSPPGAIANTSSASQAGIPANRIGNHNGKMTENVVASQFRLDGYHVQQNVMVNTPLGMREVDILATKHVGHPTLSEDPSRSQAGA